MASPLFQSIRDAAPTLSVGMLTADLGHLSDEMRLLAATGVRLVHFDVMDGCFCPMTTLGPPVIRSVRTSMVKDVHLMIREPLGKVGDYVAAGADVVTVHAESDPHIHRVLQELGRLENVNDPERGLVRGIALNPGTPLEALKPLLEELELVLLLAVNPGWGGQMFAASTPHRLERVQRMIEDSGHEILLGVDGGITRHNLGDVVEFGPDLIVTGSAVFDGNAPADNAKAMLEIVANTAGRA